MDTEKLFNDKSDLYASSRPLYPLALFNFIKTNCNGFVKAWDCATGNGQAAQGLSEIFEDVEATDISKNQIASRISKPNIRYSVQSADSTDFRESAFDLVNVAQALHWFEGVRFWEEVQRVLKPDGLFVAYTYAWSFVTDEIDKAVIQLINKPIESYWAENNQLCWNGYSDVVFPFPRIETPDIMMTNNWTCTQFMNYLQTWSGTRLCIKDLGIGFFESATNQISEIWGDEKVRTVRTPLTIVAGYNWEN